MIAPAGLGPKINGDFIAGFLASNTEPSLKVWLGELVHKPPCCQVLFCAPHLRHEKEH